jgi:hypothetical protein
MRNIFTGQATPRRPVPLDITDLAITLTGS